MFPSTNKRELAWTRNKCLDLLENKGLIIQGFGKSTFFKTHDWVIKLDTNSKNRPKASLHKGGGRWPPPTKGVGRSAAHPLCGNPLWRLAFGLFFEFVSNSITQSCVLETVDFRKLWINISVETQIFVFQIQGGGGTFNNPIMGLGILQGFYTDLYDYIDLIWFYQ